MKLSKSYIWYTIIVLLVLFIGGEYFITHPSKKGIDESTIQKIATGEELKNILDKTDSKMIVLDLYADWCGPCRMIHPTLLKLANKYKGKAVFYQVNVDQNPEIAAAFGTQAIPFVVFIKDNKIVTTMSGVNSSYSYEKVISEYATSKVPSSKVIEKL